MRWFPFAASCIAVTSLVLSLQDLLAGTGKDGFEDAAIITFNTSSLGMADYLNSTSPSRQNISTLLPHGITKPSSLTQYLGIKDWYSIHYLRNCSGYFAPDVDNPSRLSATKTNIVCTHQHTGYHFNLNNIIQRQLKPGVQELAGNIAANSYDTSPWVALWIMGIVFNGMVILLLPHTWGGVARINGYCSLVALLGQISYSVSAGLATGAIHSAHRHATSSTPSVSNSSAFVGMAWGSVALMTVVFILEQLEWRFELWTSKGERITMYRKPELRSWSILDALAGPLRAKGVHPEEHELDEV